jgi:hypothetical protein
MSVTKTLAAACAVAALSSGIARAEFSGDARAVAENQIKIDQSQWVLQPLKDEARSVCRGYIALNTERWQMQLVGAGTNGAAANQPALYKEFTQLSQRENTALQRCSRLQWRANSCIVAHQGAVVAHGDVTAAMRAAAQQEPGACVVPGADDR